MIQFQKLKNWHLAENFLYHNHKEHKAVGTFCAQQAQGLNYVKHYNSSFPLTIYLSSYFQEFQNWLFKKSDNLAIRIYQLAEGSPFLSFAYLNYTSMNLS